MKLIYGERIKQAREYCGLTQTSLAEKLKVNQSAIAHIENGRYMPSADLLQRIAEETGFTPPFFEQEPTDSFPIGSLSFRSRRTTTAREQAQAYQSAKTIFEQVSKMALRLSLPPCKLPRLAGKPQPVIAARMTRVSLGLSPDMPVKDLTRAIEKNGCFVFVLPVILPKIDAFSMWAAIDTDRPIVAVSAGKPADRLRFSIAHEIGHLVMHHASKGELSKIENEADKFAAEFLLPETAMRSQFVRPVTLSSLATLKLHWAVSMQALAYRAHELKIVTDRQYRYLFEQMGARGWRQKEPGNLDPRMENAQMLRKMVELLYDSPEQYARDMHLQPGTAAQFILYW